jgi:hypothetical protein
MQVAVDLRVHLSKVTEAQTRDFVEEAIKTHLNNPQASEFIDKRADFVGP